MRGENLGMRHRTGLPLATQEMKRPRTDGTEPSHLSTNNVYTCADRKLNCSELRGDRSPVECCSLNVE